MQNFNVLYPQLTCVGTDTTSDCVSGILQSG